MLLTGDMATLSSFLALCGVSIQIFVSFIPCNTLKFLGVEQVFTTEGLTDLELAK